MDIVVENGTGLPTANSYISAEEADEILSVNIHSVWSEIDDEETKEKLCMWATRLLDGRAKWFGCKMYGTSGLAWPRSGVRDKEGFPIEDDIVPRQVKIATALLADHLLSGNPELVNTSSNLTKLQVDVIELSFDSRQAVAKYPREIAITIDGLGRISMGGGGPKHIIRH
ncbi:DnaT-like ssDNA-binding protein [Sphingobium sp. MK2]|uniref:DnaT-like ssDNA-binding protein n=1 Tax=Sphingobium sp. MK2 TaxID=3116540 RepID=UPI0032E36352